MNPNNENETNEEIDALENNVSSKEDKTDINKKPKKGKKKTIIIVILSIFIVLIIGLLLFFMFFKKPQSKIIKNDVKKVYSKYKMSGNGLENFDLSFLQLENNNQNLIYSPLSIKYALSMLSAGSNGTTKSQIDAVIGDYKASKYINSSNMSFANAMFIRNTFKDGINENYINTLKEKYGADVIYDAFENPDTLNSWVNKNTLGLLNNLVDNVDDAQFFLINALAIDMSWNHQIQIADVNEEAPGMIYNVHYNHENYYDSVSPIADQQFDSVKFSNNKNVAAAEVGATINKYDIVKTLGEENIRKEITEEYEVWKKNPENSGMEEDTTTFVDNFIKELNSNYNNLSISTDFSFYDDNDVKVFSKDLKEYDGVQLEYIGIMPKEEELSEYIKNTNAEKLIEVIKKIKPLTLDSFEEGKVTKITGGIPFFKYDYRLDNFQKDLNKLGIKDIFDKDKADLSKMTKDKNMFIDKVIHKANIEFTNDGIKASAATAGGGYGSVSAGFDHLYDVPVVEIDLNFDKPYLYIIRDKKTGEVWFTGSVYEPIENTNQSANIINEKKTSKF